mmetsp:Transcript_93589/g.267787  ORF Transcript_93589/g.267787 Transcript_93589/m.267787 type:complete len:228 (-) Transcript_93589:304-987(-)
MPAQDRVVAAAVQRAVRCGEARLPGNVELRERHGWLALEAPRVRLDHLGHNVRPVVPQPPLRPARPLLRLLVVGEQRRLPREAAAAGVEKRRHLVALERREQEPTVGPARVQRRAVARTAALLAPVAVVIDHPEAFLSPESLGVERCVLAHAHHDRLRLVRHHFLHAVSASSRHPHERADQVGAEQRRRQRECVDAVDALLYGRIFAALDHEAAAARPAFQPRGRLL